MSHKKNYQDKIRQIITYLASSVSLIILIMIFSFIFIKGKNTLSFDMIRNDYWSENR